MEKVVPDFINISLLCENLITYLKEEMNEQSNSKDE